MDEIAAIEKYVCRIKMKDKNWIGSFVALNTKKQIFLRIFAVKLLLEKAIKPYFFIKNYLSLSLG